MPDLQELNKSDAIANMMLSTSVKQILKKYLESKSIEANDSIILKRGSGLLKSIVKGYSFVDPQNPPNENGFSVSIDDMEVFQDTAELFLREDDFSNISVINDFCGALNSISDLKGLIENDKVNLMIHLFEKLAQQFFINATDEP